MENRPSASSGSNAKLLELLEQRAGTDRPNQNSVVVPMSAHARYVPRNISSVEEIMITLSNQEAFSLFHTKLIQWNNTKLYIILQNENGPCPLIAIVNVLLIRGSLQLPTNSSTITTIRLLQGVAECILATALVDHSSKQYTADHLRKIQWSLENLAGLTSGLNVNFKFSGPTDFEDTEELAIFSVLDIPLFHGWVVFNEPETIRAVGDLSYNQLTEKIVSDRNSEDPVIRESAMVAEDFLTATASQMTYEGLVQLNCIMKPMRLGVLFRNNHFSTIFKSAVARDMAATVHDPLVSRPASELFLLVTDQGFLNEPTIVWETLDNIEGDGTFVDGTLENSPPKSMDGVYTSSSGESLKLDPIYQQQIDHDFMVALSLQNEQKSIGSSSKSAASVGKFSVSSCKFSVSSTKSTATVSKSTASVGKSTASVNSDVMNWQPSLHAISVSSFSSYDRNWQSNRQGMQVSNASSITNFSSDDGEWKPIWLNTPVGRANFADRHKLRTSSSTHSDMEYARGFYREDVMCTKNRRTVEVEANRRASVMLAFDPLEQERDPGDPSEDLEAASQDLFGPAYLPRAKKVTAPVKEARVSIERGVRVSHMVDLSTSPNSSLLGSSDDDEVYYLAEEGPDPNAPEPSPGILSGFGICAIL